MSHEVPRLLGNQQNIDGELSRHYHVPKAPPIPPQSRVDWGKWAWGLLIAFVVLSTAVLFFMVFGASTPRP